MASEKVEVKVGQVWRDWDIRRRSYHDNRYVIVDRIEGEKAICFSCDVSGRILFRREYKILLRRFRPNSSGYKLISERVN